MLVSHVCSMQFEAGRWPKQEGRGFNDIEDVVFSLWVTLVEVLRGEERISRDIRFQQDCGY